MVLAEGSEMEGSHGRVGNRYADRNPPSTGIRAPCT